MKKAPLFFALLMAFAAVAYAATAMTINGDVLFSPDNTNDIGASGVSRPRDLWLGRNLRVNGSAMVDGNATVTGNLIVSSGATFSNTISTDTLSVNNTTSDATFHGPVAAVRGVRLATGGSSKPTCISSVRGTFWLTTGGAGVKDDVEVCVKDASDTHAWRTILLIP